MASDRLFEMLAQAKARPDRWSRDLSAGTDALTGTLGGYLQGRQIKQQLGKPEAMARLLNATPQGHDIVQTMGEPGAEAALYDASPKDVMDWAGKQRQTDVTRELGLGGIAEKGKAAQLAYQAATGRTGAMRDIAGGKGLDTIITNHMNMAKSLNDENARLASSLPTGMGSTIQNLIATNGNIDSIADPRAKQIAAQMKYNQGQIDQHNMTVKALTSRQFGNISGDNSDVTAINLPSSGGDNSIPTGLPGFGNF
jgi:hypothetical protein